MNECTLASHDLCFSQLNAILFNNPQHEFWKMASCCMWLKRWKPLSQSHSQVPKVDEVSPIKEMPNGILSQQITQHQPQTGLWDLKAREKLYNAQKCALAQSGGTVAPLRVCSAISASHDFSVSYFWA